MPYGRTNYSSKRGNKKGYKKRYSKYSRRRSKNPAKYDYSGRSNYKLSIATSPLLLPDRLRVKMKYADSVNIGASNQVGTSHWGLEYRLNGLLQPGAENTNGQSHQLAANGFGQWREFYYNFRVNSSKIRCHFLRTQSTSSYDDGSFQYVSVRPINGGDQVVAANDVAVQALTDPYVKYTTLGSSASGSGDKVLTNYCETKKLYGLKSLDQNYYYGGVFISFDGSMGASPSDPDAEAFWLVTISPLDNTLASGSESADCYVQTTITYYVELYNRRDTDMSNEQ